MRMGKRVAAAISVLVAFVLVVCVAGCSSSKKKSSSSDSSAQTEQKTEEQSESTKTKEETAEAEKDQKAEQAEKAEKKEEPKAESKYAVTIDSAKVGEDYSHNPCVFVTYTFTNVSDDEPTSFMTALHAEVYQNGVQCETAFADTDGGGNSMTKVRAGSSIEVTSAYELQDTTSDVEVEVGELFSWDNTKLATKSFQIA